MQVPCLRVEVKNIDEACCLAAISSIDWFFLIESSTDLNSAVENWKNTLSLIIEKHAPMRQRRISERYCSWMTSELKVNIRSRDKL